METNIYETQTEEREVEFENSENLNLLQAVAMTVVAIIAVTLGTIYGSIM